MLLIKPNVYETSIEIIPPELKDITQLNIVHVGVDAVEIDAAVNVDTVYTNFVSRLMSTKNHLVLVRQSNLKEYFDAENNLGDLDVLQNFNEQLSITLPVDLNNQSLLENPHAIKIAFKSNRAAISYDVINTLINIINEDAKVTLKNNLIANLNIKIQNNSRLFSFEDKNINTEIIAQIALLTEEDNIQRALILENIESLTERATRNRNDRIIRLQEAYKIASKLGIKNPITPINLQSSPEPDTIITLDAKHPIGYWLGTKALLAEISILKARENDAAFITELSNLQRDLRLLEKNQTIIALQAREDNLSFSNKLREIKQYNIELHQAVEAVNQAEFDNFQFILPPILPNTPIEPNRMLIIAIAMILGLFLGLFIALVRHSINKSKDKDKK